VVASLPFFLVAPTIVAQTDLVLTVPRKIAEGYARHLDVVLLEPPLDVGGFDLRMAWPIRADAEPASRWLRGLIADVAAQPL
jgi:DNA-binding transcriptional LysR family regulator